MPSSTPLAAQLRQATHASSIMVAQPPPRMLLQRVSASHPLPGKPLTRIRCQLHASVTSSCHPKPRPARWSACRPTPVTTTSRSVPCRQAVQPLVGIDFKLGRQGTIIDWKHAVRCASRNSGPHATPPFIKPPGHRAARAAHQCRLMAGRLGLNSSRFQT